MVSLAMNIKILNDLFDYWINASNISYEARMFKHIANNAVLFPLTLLKGSVASVIGTLKFLSLVLCLRTRFLLPDYLFLFIAVLQDKF